MDVRWLRVLVELADRGTLRAVADATGYSTSAVSQQLSSLQREIGDLAPKGRPVGQVRLAGYATALILDVVPAVARLRR